MKIALKILLLFIILLLFGCTPKHTENMHTTQIFALDTVIDITAYGDNATEAVSAASKEIYRLEKLLSVTKKGSDVYKLNNAEGDAVAINSETYYLIQKAIDMHKCALGKFDITIYPVLRLWGFTEKNYRVPSNTEIENALCDVNIKNIILSENNTAQLIGNTQIDLGGIAKGYIADKAAQAMNTAGCTSGIISLGGNVRTVGTKQEDKLWSIGIKHPESTDYFATLSTDECSVITSGAYQRNFTEKGVTYHHILDPKTGTPSDSKLISATIIGTDGAVCDALSTAIFIGGADYAESVRQTTGGFEYVLLTKDNCVIASKGLENKLLISENFTDLSITFR